MIDLYFRNAVSVITIALVLGMLAFIVLSITNGSKIQKWGRLIALFIVVGVAISALSATRDGFAAQNALFGMTSMQTLVCSLAGGAIALTGIVSIFLRKQAARRVCFHIISTLFVTQVLVVEISRAAMLPGVLA
jgi:hypothetical protein